MPFTCDFKIYLNVSFIDVDCRDVHASLVLNKCIRLKIQPAVGVTLTGLFPALNFDWPGNKVIAPDALLKVTLSEVSYDVIKDVWAANNYAAVYPARLDVRTNCITTTENFSRLTDLILLMGWKISPTQGA